MAEIARKFIPLQEANAEFLKINLDLPNCVNPDSIGVNVWEVGRMCEIGGINHLRVIGEAGEISSTEVNIVGFTQEGGAYAGKGKKSFVPTSQSESKLSNERSPFFVFGHSAEWIDATIKINTEETTNQILHDKRWKEGVRSPEAWAGYLNQDIKRDLIAVGTHHLLFGLSKKQLLFTLFAMMPIYPSYYSDLTALTETMIINNTVGGLISRFILKLVGERVRYSLFLGPEIDRALALYIRGKIHTLVREIRK